MDSLFFKSFPDEKLKEKVLNDYLQKGELSGGEAASILNEEFGTDYYGIETQTLYNENKKAFLEALQKEKQVLDLLGKIESELEVKADKLFSPSTKTFHEKEKAFHQESIDLIEYVKSLLSLPGGHRPTKQSQSKNQIASGATLPRNDNFAATFPELQKALVVEDNEKRFKGEKFDRATNKLIEDVQKVLAGLPKEKRIEMGEMIQVLRTGQASPGVFVKRVKELSQGMNLAIKIPEVLKPTAQHARTLSSIQGTKLFEELESLEENLRNSLPQSEEERALLQDFRHLELLRRLAKLELSSKQWEELEREMFGSFPALDPELFSPALDFYRLATKRDEALFENMNRLVEKKKAKLAVIVTGGFHSAGITRKLKDSNIPFVLISPQIHQTGDKDNYFNVMQGKASYMRYFKKSLWDALAQDYAAKLAASMNPTELTPSLKRWRDRIIQNSIAEGRITSANAYTRYVDALVQALRKEFDKANPTQEELREKMEKELNSFLSNYFDGLRISINQKLEIFGAGLKEMWKAGDITPQSVQHLLNQVHVAPRSNLAIALVLINNRGRVDSNLIEQVKALDSAKIDPQAASFYARLSEQFPGRVGQVLETIKSSPRSEMRAKSEPSEIPPLGEDEIAISLHGVAQLFIGEPSVFLRKILSELPDPSTVGENQISVGGIDFGKRKRGGYVVWSFKAKDAFKISEHFGLPLRQDIPELSPDEIGASGKELERVFVGTERNLLNRIKPHLPNPRAYKKNKFVIGRIVFERRKRSSTFIWSFKKKDLQLVAQQFNLKIRVDIPELGKDEIPISPRAIRRFFVVKRDDLYKEVQSQLPDPNSFSESRIVRDQIIFEKRKSGKHLVWAFPKEKLREVAQYFNLELKPDVPALGEGEIIVSGPGLAEVFSGKYTDLGRKFLAELPDPKQWKENNFTLGQVLFEKRSVGGHVLWVFKEKDRIKLAEHFGVHLRKEISDVGGDEIVVSVKSLAKVFIGDSAELAKLIKSQLPDPETFEENEFVLGNVGFEKRRTKGGQVVWVFNREDRDKIAAHFSFQVRGVLETQAQEKAKQVFQIKEKLQSLYEQDRNFEERIDITPMISRPNLRAGLIPEDFPLPNQRIWGPDNRYLRVGRDLYRVEALIKKIKGKLSIEFIGYRRSEVRVSKSHAGVPELGENEIAVSHPGLVKTFVGTSETLMEKFKASLPLPDVKGKETQFLLREIKFEKRKVPGHVVWAFKEEDAEKVGQYAGLKLRSDYDIPEIGADEIAVAWPTISRVFVGSPKQLIGKFKQEGLPDLKEYQPPQFKLGDVIFEKRLSSNNLLWVFQRKDLAKLASYLGLQIKAIPSKEIRPLKNGEIAVWRRSITRIFSFWAIGEMQNVLPNPLTEQKEKISVGGVEYEKRLMGVHTRC